MKDGGIRIRQSPEPRGRGYVGRREKQLERRNVRRVERRDERRE